MGFPGNPLWRAAILGLIAACACAGPAAGQAKTEAGLPPQKESAATNIEVTIDGYKHQFKGGGCQSTRYGTHFSSMSGTEQAQAWDFLFSDINMGCQQNAVRFGTEARKRNPDIAFSLYLGNAAVRDAKGRLDLTMPDVYKVLATNWFNSLQSEHLAGRSVKIGRLLNEPDWGEKKLSGALGYPGNPQKGFALIIEQSVGRLVDMLANPAINTNGVPRPLCMFPNTLDAGQCTAYLTEIKKSAYPRAWGLVDIVSTHQYNNGANVSVFNTIAAAAAGRWMIISEMYPNRGDSLGALPIDAETRSVLSLAQLISVPVNAGFNSWWYWQTHYPGGHMGLLEIPWNGPANRDKHYWGFRQLTSLQPYNSYVLTQSVTDLGSVSVIAMREKSAPHVTLSVANNEGSFKSAGIQLKRGSTVVTPYAYYQYLTDSNHNMTVSGPVLVAPGASTFDVGLEPYSLTTIRVLLGPPSGVPAALAHWAMDDASGRVAADCSGNARHANLGVNNTWTSGMNQGGAVQFPADYYPTTASHNLGSVTQLTYSARFKRGAPTGNQELGGSTGTNAWKVLHYTSVNALRVSIGSDHWDTSVQATTNEWHHLVLTIDVPTKTVRLYLDGALRASTVRSAMSPITLDSIDWGARVNGPMDDVWLFNSVLNQSQVEKLHAASRIVVPPRL